MNQAAVRIACIFAVSAVTLLLDQHRLWAANAANDLHCALFQPRGQGVLSVCEGPFPGTGGDIVISLIGHVPNAVSEIRLSRAPQEQPFQTLTLEVRPVIDVETVGILFMDMNFDGYADLGVMRSLSDGYRYFLFEPQTGAFVANSPLDAIAWPEFDAERKTIRSYVPENNGRSRYETFIWSHDALHLDPVK